MPRLVAALLGLTMAAALPVATAQPAFAAEGRVLSTPGAQIIPDRYLVTLKNGAQPRAEVDRTAHALTSRYGGTVRTTWRHALHGFSAVLSERQAAALAADPAVASVETDAVVRVAETQPNPPSWGLDRIDQPFRPLDYSYTYPNNGIRTYVYVIDTGIATAHSEFSDGNRAWVGYDALGGNGQDCNGHGTHVAGTIGSTRYGVAKKAFLIGVRVLDCNGSGSYEGVIAGVDWVTSQQQRPAVANMSLGGGLNQTLNNAVATSIASGVTYTIASGNSNANACNFSPASVGTALTVNSSDSSDVRAGTSNWGSCTDLFAPGVNITSTWLNNGINTISGTSMAAPHVAGVAAIYLAWYPTASPAQVANAITSIATQNVISNPSGSPNRLLYVSFPNPNNPPQGQVEAVERYGAVRGWARDPDGVANPCTVSFYIDGPAGTGTFAGQTVASLPRSQDPVGSFGFAWVLPNQWRDGQQHTLYVYAQEAAAGLVTLIGTRTFTAHRPPVEADFTGDGRTDVSLWRPADGTWYVLPSDGSSYYGLPFGQNGDRPVSGDFDGDRRADTAVFRPATQVWHVQQSRDGYRAVFFGLPTDRPVPADYDGDGRTDIAQWRASEGTWYIQTATSYYSVPFGASTDRPVPGDYDGDGRADLAVFRPATGTWIVQQSSNAQVTYAQWGLSDDQLVPADYDGDGRTDLAVFRASEGNWYVRNSLDDSWRVQQWGAGTDVLAPGDYDGDSRADLTTFRPQDNGHWFIRRSSDGAEQHHNFGQPLDIPIPATNLTAS